MMTELCEIGTRYGTDKAPWCWAYTEIYSRWVPRDIRTVLEIGVLKGASLRMWRDYFPAAKVYGVDNDPNCMVEGENRIETFCFNAYDIRELAPLLEKIRPLDFFIDDALHDARTQVGLLRVVWPYMKRGGVYAIEDLYTQVDVVETAASGMPYLLDSKLYAGKEGYSMLIMRKA